MENSLQALRKEYHTEPLNEEGLPINPYELFSKWLQNAIDARLMEPNGMTLSTISLENKPAARTVLLKKFNEKGFVFFTNYESRKAIQLYAHPFAALTFWWKELIRQVCIEGGIEKISYEESEEYFQTRPRGSQIAAWSSPQSLPVTSRKELEVRYELIKKSHENEIHCPPYWGGFRLVPERFEFWQGGENRFNDRFLYLPQDSSWKMFRLAP